MMKIDQICQLNEMLDVNASDHDGSEFYDVIRMRESNINSIVVYVGREFCALIHLKKSFINWILQVSNTLTRLEGVNNFTEFVKAFSQFGSEMVDFALVTGDRQNDLKDERRRAQMSAARTILERSTLMLLTASKVTSLSWSILGFQFILYSSIHYLLFIHSYLISLFSYFVEMPWNAKCMIQVSI